MTTYLGLRLDAGHDLFLDATGNLATTTDAHAVGQVIQQRLLAYRGEWFVDDLVGVPWVQQVLVRPFNEVVAEAVIKETVVSTLGVRTITALDLDVRQSGRELAVLRLRVLTEFDETIEVTL